MDPKRFALIVGLFVTLMVGIGAFVTFAIISEPRSGSASDSSFAAFIPIYCAAIIPVIAMRKKRLPEKMTDKQRKIIKTLMGAMAAVSVAVTIAMIIFMSGTFGAASIVIAVVIFALAIFSAWNLLKVDDRLKK